MIGFHVNKSLFNYAEIKSAIYKIKKKRKNDYYPINSSKGVKKALNLYIYYS